MARWTKGKKVMTDDRLRTRLTVTWTRVVRTPMSMSFEAPKPFRHVKTVRRRSLWLRWLLRSVPIQFRIERDPFGDDVVVYFKQRDNTAYLIGFCWVDKPRAIERIDTPVRAALAAAHEERR